MDHSEPSPAFLNKNCLFLPSLPISKYMWSFSYMFLFNNIITG